MSFLSNIYFIKYLDDFIYIGIALWGTWHPQI